MLLVKIEISKFRKDLEWNVSTYQKSHFSNHCILPIEKKIGEWLGMENGITSAHRVGAKTLLACQHSLIPNLSDSLYWLFII